jgi:hypothetical protein
MNTLEQLLEIIRMFYDTCGPGLFYFLVAFTIAGLYIVFNVDPNRDRSTKNNL